MRLAVRPPGACGHRNSKESTLVRDYVVAAIPAGHRGADFACAVLRPAPDPPRRIRRLEAGASPTRAGRTARRSGSGRLPQTPDKTGTGTSGCGRFGYFVAQPGRTACGVGTPAHVLPLHAARQTGRYRSRAGAEWGTAPDTR